MQIDMAVSPEKIDLLTSLAQTFNRTGRRSATAACSSNPKSKASGAAMQALADGWDENAEGPQPVVWSPASSAWGAILDQRLADKGQPAMANQGTPFMNTPLVIAMPKPMAEALGLAGQAARLVRHPEPRHEHAGLGRLRPSRVGIVQARQDQPELLDQRSVGADRAELRRDRQDPRPHDRGSRQARASSQYNRSVESSVVHYGDTTLTFLNNWYRADQEGTALTYVSAVAVEEKSVIDYNTGNPDGTLDPGEEPRPPRIPLVAIYPKEGTLFSDSPFFVLDAPWVEPGGARRCARVPDLRAAAREPATRARVQLPSRQPRGADRVRRSPPTTASTRTSPRRCCRCRHRP